MEKYVVIKKANLSVYVWLFPQEDLGLSPASINLKIRNLREGRGGIAEEVYTCAGIFTQFF